MLDQLCLRPAQKNDANFIFSSWLKSHEMSSFARYIPSKVFYNYHKEIVQKILEKSSVVIASASDDADHILGYLVYSVTDEKLYVHYCYVKQVYRQMGVAKSMFDRLWESIPEDATAIATHASWFFPHLNRHWKMIYNPYTIERFTA